MFPYPFTARIIEILGLAADEDDPLIYVYRNRLNFQYALGVELLNQGVDPIGVAEAVVLHTTDTLIAKLKEMEKDQMQRLEILRKEHGRWIRGGCA